MGIACPLVTTSLYTLSWQYQIEWLHKVNLSLCQQITLIIYQNLFPNKGKPEALGWEQYNRQWICVYRLILKIKQFKEGFSLK